MYRPSLCPPSSLGCRRCLVAAAPVPLRRLLRRRPSLSLGRDLLGRDPHHLHYAHLHYDLHHALWSIRGSWSWSLFGGRLTSRGRRRSWWRARAAPPASPSSAGPSTAAASASETSRCPLLPGPAELGEAPPRAFLGHAHPLGLRLCCHQGRVHIYSVSPEVGEPSKDADADLERAVAKLLASG